MEELAGINHVTLAVADLDRSLAFYEGVLGCRRLARWPRGAYLLAGELWLALIVDGRVRPGPLPEYTHVAFAVAPGAFAACATRLRACGVSEWKQNESEGDSVYLLDPDGHKLEVHATALVDRLRSALAAPWEGLELTDLARGLVGGS